MNHQFKRDYNQTVAICDSGIASHSDLDASRIVWQYDYVNLDGIAEDEYGHGTYLMVMLYLAINMTIASKLNLI